MTMTIHDYIKKHHLELWRRVDWPARSLYSDALPSFLVDSRESGSRAAFEIYSDKDCTHFVSLNLTHGLFRIVHMDLVVIASDWNSIESHYEVSKALGLT